MIKEAQSVQSDRIRRHMENHDRNHSHIVRKGPVSIDLPGHGWAAGLDSNTSPYMESTPYARSDDYVKDGISTRLTQVDFMGEDCYRQERLADSTLSLAAS